MRKRIAVFACGWSNEYLMVVSQRFEQYASAHNADMFYFLNYSNSGAPKEDILRESNIFSLPDLTWFDGVVVLGNTLHSENEYRIIMDEINRTNVPAVCLGYQLDGISNFMYDNYNGMYELAVHLMDEHNVKDILFVGGPLDNQENNLRRKALEDVMYERGLTLSKERIVCANWNYYDAQRIVEEWYRTHDGKIPHAIVCANDVMAMGVYVALSKCGITSLEEVIVTGFDNLISAEMFTPSITSVDPGWEESCNKAMDHLWKCMDGKNEIVNEIILSHLVKKCSCGCVPEKLPMMREGAEVFIGYERMVSGSYVGGHNCELANAISEIRQKKHIKNFMEYLMNMPFRLEGNEIYFCLVDNFFESLDSEELLPIESFTSKMELVGGIRNNSLVENVVFDSREIFPYYDCEKETSDSYLIISLSSKKECYGYSVIVNNLRMIYDYSLFMWSLSIGHNFESMRQNLRIEEMTSRLKILSVTDALTGLYNRMGCEKIAFPLIKECYYSGKNAVMLFLDINKMKEINDNFGHEQGDVAICITADGIRRAIPDNWVAIRYGGDEFLVAGECPTEKDAEYISKQILKEMMNIAHEQKVPYSVTAGIGAVYVKPEDELDLYRCLRIADAKMYKMKKERRKE